MSFLQQANSSNFASMFVVLDPFDKRQSPSLRDTAIMARCGGVGQAGQGRAGHGVRRSAGAGPRRRRRLQAHGRGSRRTGSAELQRQTDELVDKLQSRARPDRRITQFRSNTPQLYMDIDRTKAASLGVSLDDVNQTLQIYLGSLYVNSFNDSAGTGRSPCKPTASFATASTDINLLKSATTRARWSRWARWSTCREIGGPILVTRYNLYAAAPIIGNLPPGVSSGDAIAAIDAHGQRDACRCR